MNKQIKAISNKNNITISVVDLKNTINKITKLDNKIVDEMAARLVLGNALLMLEEKNIDCLTISLNLNSNIKKIYSEIYGKKYVRNQIIVDDNCQIKDIKKNILEVNKYLNNKNISKSIVDIENENIDEIFSKYLKQSDQINSLIVTVVEMKDDCNASNAKGILIKLLPNSNNNNNYDFFKKLDVNNIRNKLLSEDINNNFINQLFDDCKITKCQSIFDYCCGCDESKFINLLLQQDKNQLKQLIKDDDELTITCNYCLKKTIIKTNKLIYN